MPSYGTKNSKGNISATSTFNQILPHPSSICSGDWVSFKVFGWFLNSVAIRLSFGRSVYNGEITLGSSVKAGGWNPIITFDAANRRLGAENNYESLYIGFSAIISTGSCKVSGSPKGRTCAWLDAWQPVWVTSLEICFDIQCLLEVLKRTPRLLSEAWRPDFVPSYEWRHSSSAHKCHSKIRPVGKSIAQMAATCLHFQVVGHPGEWCQTTISSLNLSDYTEQHVPSCLFGAEISWVRRISYMQPL